MIITNTLVIKNASKVQNSEISNIIIIKTEIFLNK